MESGARYTYRALRWKRWMHELDLATLDRVLFIIITAFSVLCSSSNFDILVRIFILVILYTLYFRIRIVIL